MLFVAAPIQSPNVGEGNMLFKLFGVLHVVSVHPNCKKTRLVFYSFYHVCLIQEVYILYLCWKVLNARLYCMETDKGFLFEMKLAQTIS